MGEPHFAQRRVNEERPVEDEIQDPIDAQLVVAVTKESRYAAYGGSPESFDMLFESLHTLLHEIDPLDVQVIIHPSCVTQDDCVVVRIEGERTIHFNTRNIPQYSRKEFIRTFMDTFQLALSFEE